MTSDSAPTAPVDTAATSSTAGRGRGRGRRDRHRARPRKPRQTNDTANDASTATTNSNNDNDSSQTGEQPSRQHRHARGRGRGRGRGAATAASLTRHVRVLGEATPDDSGREEGAGHTSAAASDAGNEGGNSNNAQRGRTRPPRARRPPRRPRRMAEPAGDEDLRATLTRTLSIDTHECMICCEVVYRRQATWSCDRCWAVFHLKCVRKWANNLLQQENATAWRCPGCQQPREEKPRNYRCFCGKHVDPEYSREHMPHSCGEPCGHMQRRAADANGSGQMNPDCRHPCSLPCHPGPCPPCAAMAPTTFCHCGKESYQVRCADYRPEGISCGEICDELLGCGKHTCERECHSGLCAPCGEREQQRCYCGRHSREAACGTGSPRDTVEAEHPEHAFTGYYSCGEQCHRWFDCGKHRCESTCHAETAASVACPFSPELVATCPCGKRPLTSLMDGQAARTACTDPIPTCEQACDRPLVCGHACRAPCHTGKCPPCEERVQVPCACHGSQIAMACHEQQQQQGDEQPRCNRVCGKLKECGKHRCNLRCCTYASDPDVHLCQHVCGKRLRCGVHRCEQLCHRGHCYPCLEATFDELSCPCGRTRLDPPIACGVTLPKCPYPCTRASSSCPHPVVPHECHPDDVACPPCVYLMARRCRCGREMVRNVPCYRDPAKITCGQVCGKLLGCGGHRCKQVCHSGPCDTVCTQRCGKRRPDCKHACQAPCHAPSICPVERVACEESIVVSCECGRLTETRKCAANGTSPVVMPLACDDECARLIRNRKLAEALQIEQFRRPVQESTHSYEDDLVAFSQNHIAFIRKLEIDLATYLDSKSSSPLYLPTMKADQRRAVHMLCQHYSMETTSIDPEPKRSVVVRRTRLSLAPTPLLSQVAGGHFPNPSVGRR
ncbi:hypothetical protein SYNPS1DRAFT_12399 [Syncephalis pseudoplumigaleata]|uniref:R3H domain-containing protein n=1 Tax=Syncephalis pseudoplumigaleata TaxID=1712513 RepID=A0A4V1J279_9FUNG|nr:hypothetical protein SYNPS1DRAFT_12399 [Syncephalis pseudoplumigaleata]|eukprot:RKP27619.1 hypothetical protein SYNPS1DRAFT_12399 [Syncephalis pseudoplumigaleata]